MQAIEYTANPFATRPAGHFADLLVSNDEYHTACDGISNSMLGDFLSDPALFEGLYLSKRYQRPQATSDQDFGTLVHSVLLEDGLSRILEIPTHVLAKDGSRRGSAWHAFELEHAGKTLLKSGEIAPLREIWANANKCPLVSKLLYLSKGANECSFEWLDASTGLLLRMRLDRLAEYNGFALIADIKTTAANDARSFAASCVRWGYHRQAAFYRAGVESIEGYRPPFVFLVIRKSPPYSIQAYELSDEFQALGENELKAGLKKLAICRDANIWTSPTAGRILQLDCPRWALDTSWEFSE
jgi:hypothetical protein